MNVRIGVWKLLGKGIYSMFRIAERTFTIAECTFTIAECTFPTAECRFTIAEHRTDAYYNQIRTAF